MKIENPDVLIIGAGAAGAAAAWSLSETNLKIVCLEQGGFMNPDEYPSTKFGWEAMKYDKFNVSPNVRKLQSDYPINDLESPIAIANFNAVGGSTILYSGHFPRFHPSDFKVNELDGVADDWPMNYFDLEPFLLASIASAIFSELICLRHLLVKHILVVVFLCVKSDLVNLLIF